MCHILNLCKDVRTGCTEGNPQPEPIAASIENIMEMCAAHQFSDAISLAQQEILALEDIPL